MQKSGSRRTTCAPEHVIAQCAGFKGQVLGGYARDLVILLMFVRQGTACINLYDFLPSSAQRYPHWFLHFRNSKPSIQ
jgi:hypothetical protein